MLDVLDDDYVRTARGKGLRATVVVARHALPNALLPVVTNIGLQAGALLGGALIIETVFGLPGLGRLMVEGIALRDYPVVQGVTLLVATLMIGVNLLCDALCLVLDPRLRQGGR